MPNYRVTILHDACTTHDVAANTEADAVAAAMEDAGVSLCHYCSDKVDMGEPIRAVCVANLGAGESNTDADPDFEVVNLRARVADLEAMLAAAQPPAAQPESAQPVLATGAQPWQPILTAPKDGTVLLLWESYETEPFIGYWHDFRGRWMASTTHYDTDGNACVIDRVYSEGVTHWMPLPAPPRAAHTGSAAE